MLRYVRNVIKEYVTFGGSSGERGRELNLGGTQEDFFATNPTSNSVVLWNKTALRAKQYLRRSRCLFYSCAFLYSVELAAEGVYKPSFVNQKRKICGTMEVNASALMVPCKVNSQCLRQCFSCVCYP